MKLTVLEWMIIVDTLDASLSTDSELLYEYHEKIREVLMAKIVEWLSVQQIEETEISDNLFCGGTCDEQIDIELENVRTLRGGNADDRTS